MISKGEASQLQSPDELQEVPAEDDPGSRIIMQ